MARPLFGPRLLLKTKVGRASTAYQHLLMPPKTLRCCFCLLLYFSFCLFYHSVPCSHLLTFQNEKQPCRLCQALPRTRGKRCAVSLMFDTLTLFCFLFMLLPPSFFFSSLVSVWVCMSQLMMALVSCQVSSLLALSVTQRSDKKKPGVGLSLPLAKEVSFSPSIIHILFNLTR